jgi:hypothetical protein
LSGSRTTNLSDTELKKFGGPEALYVKQGHGRLYKALAWASGITLMPAMISSSVI